MICNQCHWHENIRPCKDCSFCEKLEFNEEILCSIASHGTENDGYLDCGAFKPKISIVTSANHSHIDRSESETLSLSKKDNWLVAYSKQQLQLNPDKINFKLQFHLCLISKSRNVIFLDLSEHLEKVNNIFSEISSSFDNTQIEVLWVGADHIHLYVNTIPDYALDEIASKLICQSEKEIISTFQKTLNKSSFAWEKGYFAETIG